MMTMLQQHWTRTGHMTLYFRQIKIELVSVTHTTHNCFTALSILSGTTRVSRYQKKHSPTHTHRGHQISLSASSIYYDPWYPPYSIHVLYKLYVFTETVQLK